MPRPTRVHVGLFIALFAAGGAWSLSVPVFSAPDEHAHVIRAAGIWHGDVVPRQAPLPPLPGPVPLTPAPAAYAEAVSVITCYLHRPAVAASCAPPLPGGDATADVATLAGRYPPLYYAAVGSPVRAATPTRAVYGMRLLSATVFALLATLAIGLSRRLGPSGPVGVALAITPVGLYLGGMVNPNGFEIAAAIATWAGAAVLIKEPPPRAVLVITAVAASALTLARGLSPLWLATIAVAALLALPAGRRRQLLGQPGVWVAAVVAGIATALAGVWVVAVGGLSAAGSPMTEPWTERLRVVAGRVPTFMRQTIGEPGFLDAPTPAAVYWLWIAALAVLVVAALRRGSGRQRLALAAVAAAAVLLSVALETWESRTIGLFWQGRYILPVAAGIPVLAGAWAQLGNRARLFIGAAVAAAHVVMYVATVRRYAVGAGRWAYWTGEHWAPPVPAAALLILFAASVIAIVTLVLRPPDQAQARRSA